MRPRVLLACRSTESATVFRTLLAPVCIENGLRLQVGTLSTDHFESSEELVHTLAAMPAEDLLDTLLLLFDVGPDVDECFSSSIRTGQSRWHVSHLSKPGIGLDLTLRFPQLWVVVVSALVPFSFNEEMPVFTRFCADLENTCPQRPHPKWWRLHFASSIEDDLRYTKTLVRRFARGLRCLYDPTGFRTLLRNRFLGQIFGGILPKDWRATENQRFILARRLSHTVAVIDEEPDLSLLSAYSAYKHGCCVWMVNTYEEFKTRHEATWHSARPLTVVRDLDLRFPDIPTDNDQATAENVRNNLSKLRSADHPSGISPEWTDLLGTKEAQNGLRIRVLSLDRQRVRVPQKVSGSIDDVFGEVKPANTCSLLIGLTKPISSVYAAAELLPQGFQQTLVAQMAPATEVSTGHHGAEYLNLEMASSLVANCRELRRDGGFRSSLLCALLAQEAYCLLLGMSRTTALEAMREIHLGEAQAEAESLSISHTINLEARKGELDTIAAKVSGSGGEAWDYLAKVWTELRVVYREGEQFEAAETANVESLIYRRWFSRVQWRLPQRAIGLKRFAVRAFTSASCLFAIFIGWTLFLTVVHVWRQGWYFTPSIEGVCAFLRVYSRVVTAICRAESLTVEASWYFDQSLPYYWVADVCTAISSIFFVGLTVSVIFRKVVRG